jgi:DNA-binding transcriptional ArsR family regulator
MTSRARFAEVAALAGDPARVGMLHALLDGRALTASELARVAGIAPQTASGHLARLAAVGVVSVEKQGRHHYHRLATPSVAHMLESIMHVAAELDQSRKPLSVGPKDLALRKARTCYDHFAGQLGVALADAMVGQGYVELTSDAGILTEAGLEFLRRTGIDTDPLLKRRTQRSGRVLCRPCLDWSERRTHIAGLLGAIICSHSFAAGWTRRMPDSRAVLITPKGERMFRETFRAKLANGVGQR